MLLGKGKKMWGKKWTGGALWGGGLQKILMVHNSILNFGGKKSRLGDILIVHLWIFSCEDKAMVGYNVLDMYLRIIGIFLLAFKRYVEKNHIRWSTFQRGGVMKSAPLVHFF